MRSRVRNRQWGGVFLALAAVVLAANAPQFVQGQDIVIDEGLSTTLAEAGLLGPDADHEFHPEGNIWEFDNSDGGGVNHGLLWFEIPENDLKDFKGAATLQLFVANNGNAGNMHRVTEDWVSDLGELVTWNDMPGGPGLIPGGNVVEQFNSVFPDSIGMAGEVLEVDVSADVAAWGAGEPNYGWGFLPTAAMARAWETFLPLRVRHRF